MKNSILLLFLSVCALSAHDHIEVGSDPGNPAQLAVEGPAYQLAVYVPRGESFSGYMPQFPGGWHAVELTFTTECNVLDSAAGADPRIEIVSVTGPADGIFSFWETGATQPTWSRSTGWTSGQGDLASFVVALGGDDHIHGRCFSMDKPGIYTVTFRAVDTKGAFAPSRSETITFAVQQPPQLSIETSGGDALLSFTSRSNLVYDLQICTDLASGVWSNVAPHSGVDGDGGTKQMPDPLAGRPRGFYRLVEYY
ncbi:MAG: hypothetical protein RIQ71_1733 [Verrucomicrobiota bacterium]|jgi:surface-anchored protein